MRRAASSATSASAVGAEPAPVSARRSIGEASAVSRLRICACTAGAVSPSRSAAAAIEPVSATAARARSWRRVMASSRGNSKNLNAASGKVNSHERGGGAMMLRNERSSGGTSVRDMVSTLPDLVVPQQYRQVVERIAATAADLARDASPAASALDCTRSGENADGDRQTRARPDRRRGVPHRADRGGRALLRLRGAGAGGRARRGRGRSRWRSIRSTARRTSRSTCSIGTIFAHLPRPRRRRRRASSGRGASSLGAGYVIYGPRCCLVASFGEGVQKSISSIRRAGGFRLVAGGRDAAAEVGGVRDQRLELPALGPGRSGPTSTTASPAPRGRASGTSTCAGSPRWSPRRTAS